MRKPVYAICKQQRRRSKGTDQTAHLLSTFVVRCLDMSLVCISEISSLYLASVAASAGFSLAWSKTPEADFVML